MEEPSYTDDLVTRLADTARDHVVIEDLTSRWTGAQLRGAVEKVADELRTAGVRAGDRVIIVTENCGATAIAYFATTRAKAWPILVNARLTEVELDRIRDHARPVAELFTADVSKDARRHAECRRAETLGGLTGLRLAICETADARVVVRDQDRSTADVAALLYTSGTTGEPKGVMLTHRNLLFVARESGALRRLSPADVVYGVLPISHVFGLASVFLGSLMAGSRLRLVPRFEAEAAALALADDVTVFQGVPTMYQRLLALADQRGGSLPAPNLRYLSAGGAPLDIGLKRRVEALWSLPLHNGYGLTETSPTVTTTRIEAPAVDETVGPCLPGVETAIAGANDDILPAGDIGEILVRGPNVMKGYYKAAAETARVLSPDGWFRTGDLGRIDANGNLYVVGRSKELIIRSGFNVYPPEVEAVLVQHQDVALAAVIGRRVDGNEEVVAFVEPKDGRNVDTASLARFASERLAPYKRPSHYVVCTLPTTAAGKIRKAELAGRPSG